MMLENFSHFGPDSFVGHLSSILQGCTDTTFYILAVYFGSVGIKKYRYSVACGLSADFAGIIDDTLRLRDLYAPQAKVSVLSNATYLDRPAVHEALLRVDNNIQKLDTVNPAYIARLDRPVSPRYRVEQVIERLKDFQGKVIVQTMFLTGIVDGVDLDNTGDAYVQPWLEALRRIAPQQVMIYTIDRETPDPHLRKASPASLDAICLKVQAAGFPCSVSY